MKKSISILIASVMFAGSLGTANATATKWKDAKGTKLGGQGYYKITHSLDGFDKGADWLDSYKLILRVGKNYKTSIKLNSNKISRLYENGNVSFRVRDRFGGKRVWTKLVAWGGHKGGGGNSDVPEPGMLALMALVLLGLGLGPWLRKIYSRPMQGTGF